MIPLKCKSLQPNHLSSYWEHNPKFLSWPMRACGILLPDFSPITSLTTLSLAPATLDLFFFSNTSSLLRSQRLSSFSSLSVKNRSPRYLHGSFPHFIQVPFKCHLIREVFPACYMREIPSSTHSLCPYPSFYFFTTANLPLWLKTFVYCV